MKKQTIYFQILFLSFFISCHEVSCDSLRHELNNTSFSPSNGSLIHDSIIIRASFDYESDYNEEENIYATMYAYDVDGKRLYLVSKRLKSNIGYETLEFQVDDEFLDDPVYDYPFRLILVLERVNSLMEVEMLEKSGIVTYYQ